MPPILSRKRTRSLSPSPKPDPPSKRIRAPNPPPRRGKILDAPPTAKRTLSQTKAFLEGIDTDSALSDPDSSDDDFEDVPLNSTSNAHAKAKAQTADDSEESQEDDWEDALGAHHHHLKHDHGPAPKISGDIALTLSAVPKGAFDSKPDGKKGPSKIQRQIRSVTHCIHVQYLMFHNLTRNAWLQDKQVQRILVEGLTTGCWREIEKYWRDAGISDGLSRVVQADLKVQKDLHKKITPQKEPKGKQAKWKASGSKGVKIYENPDNKLLAQRKMEAKRQYEASLYNAEEMDIISRKQRDWGAASNRVELDAPNVSHGDPLLRLMKYMSAYWKSKFKITAPGLRKRGYLSPLTLQAELDAWKEYPPNPDTFGERIENLEAFREVAGRCEGSRDVGQQLFTALIRGLGLEARVVVSLQPVGFGFSQAEQGKPKNLEKLKNLSADIAHIAAKSAATSKENKTATAPRHRRESVASVSSDSSDLSSVISISSDAEEKSTKKNTKTRVYSEELPYPTYWTEVISNLTYTPVSVSPLSRTIIASAAAPERLSEFYARGAAADKAKQVFAYLIAFSADGTAKDVTTRYLPKNQWPGRTKGFRMPVERIPIHNKRGKVKRWEEWDWVKSLLRPYARAHDDRQPWDEVEDEGDLLPAEPEKKKGMDEDGGKETLQGYKNSTEYVLERHLRREEALKPGAKVIRHFVSGKGDKEKSEPVYRRKDIVNCKSTESWHKEGREVKEGEQPLKYVPMRAVTVTRKREVEERERIEGGKVQQGLYSREQTDWIIPDPIVDGKIPRNAFGNIDVYVPTMVPSGSVHIPLKGTARVCRKLNIDYAEACTGFEFGKQRAVPVLTGVVVAAENEDLVIDAWEVEEAEKAKREANKRTALVLGMWRKFFTGLRIVERMKAEYGDDVELPTKTKNTIPTKGTPETKSQWDVFNNHTDFEGGFLRDDAGLAGGESTHEQQHKAADDDMSDGFFPASQEDVTHGELTIDPGEHQEKKRTPVGESSYRTPISLTSATQQPFDEPADEHNRNTNEDLDVETEQEDATPTSPPKPKQNGKRSIRSSAARSSKRQTVIESSEDEDDDDDEDEGENGDGHEDEDETSFSSPSSRPATPLPATRSVPRRKAARKSDAQVKSHFFTQDSDGETDMTDLTDRASPKKRVGKASGRGRGRGRGRGKD
jgi:xeroderma pigmentosum group C-complementing protein